MAVSILLISSNLYIPFWMNTTYKMIIYSATIIGGSHTCCNLRKLNGKPFSWQYEVKQTASIIPVLSKVIIANCDFFLHCYIAFEGMFLSVSGYLKDSTSLLPDY